MTNIIIPTENTNNLDKDKELKDYHHYDNNYIVDLDFWYHEIGVNLIPADTRNKRTFEEWSQWQYQSIPIETFEEWKRNYKFEKGCAVITGKIWRGKYAEKYLCCIDIDNKSGLDNILKYFGDDYTLEKLSKNTIVEMHADNKDKVHVYFIVENPLSKKSGIGILNIPLDNSTEGDGIPAIEVKSEGKHGIIYCSPSIHKGGFPYEILGTRVPTVLNAKLSQELEDRINQIYLKFNLLSEDNGQIPIEELFKSNFLVRIGNNRHECLLRIMESLIQRNKNILNEEEIKGLAEKWNKRHCEPPLDDKEVDKQWRCAKKFIDKNEISRSDNPVDSQEGSDKKSRITLDNLMELANKNIDLLFKDQHNEGYARINVDEDHFEIIPISSSKFSRLIAKILYDKCGQIVSKETINNVVYTLQAKAEFGDQKYPLSLRVAEYEGDFYYDLTNEKHRCVRVSKQQEGIWEVLDRTPVPLFRRYNQISQEVNLTHHPLSQNWNFKNVSLAYSSELSNPLDIFLSCLTNINKNDRESRLLIKTALITYFIPNIPHIIIILHGSAGSAKSTFQYLLKNIVDPSKPSLLTLHENINEFIQQLAHNYLATFDNIKYVPRWLSDEACKAVTGVGQTKRALYTDDEDKIYEYKHCLIFNGINVAFTEPDVLDRSIIIHLDEIDEGNRRTEKEILDQFKVLRPDILRFIFDTLAKAIVLKDKVANGKLGTRLPRMADFAIWGETISQVLGYREGEFLQAYYNNIGFQNTEVIDSNPVAFVIKRFVEYSCNSSKNDKIFIGSSIDLLNKLTEIAIEEKINTSQKDWPKDVKWLVRRIRIVKSNLQKALKIRINIERDSKSNTSIISMVKNDSAYSDENNMSPKVHNLTSSLKCISPVESSLSPLNKDKLCSKKPSNGENGENGDNIDRNIGNSDFGTEVILVENEDIKNSRHSPDSFSSMFECYYCDSFNATNDRTDYERHVILDHQGKLAYPDMISITKEGLVPQNKPWERK